MNEQYFNMKMCFVTHNWWDQIIPRLFGKRVYERSGLYELIAYAYKGKLFVVKYGKI